MLNLSDLLPLEEVLRLHVVWVGDIWACHTWCEVACSHFHVVHIMFGLVERRYTDRADSSLGLIRVVNWLTGELFLNLLIFIYSLLVHIKFGECRWLASSIQILAPIEIAHPIVLLGEQTGTLLIEHLLFFDWGSDDRRLTVVLHLGIDFASSLWIKLFQLQSLHVIALILGIHPVDWASCWRWDFLLESLLLGLQLELSLCDLDAIQDFILHVGWYGANHLPFDVLGIWVHLVLDFLPHIDISAVDAFLTWIVTFLIVLLFLVGLLCLQCLFMLWVMSLFLRLDFIDVLFTLLLYIYSLGTSDGAAQLS